MMTLLLAFVGVARANELTVNDGTSTNSYTPVYGLYADTQGSTTEFIIPAADLAAMDGGSISAMTFYLSSSASAAWTATFQVYLAEVSATTLSGVTGPSVGTVVYTGTLDATGSTMTVTFDTPYTYNGGNLLIGTYVSVAGNYKSAYFYGVTVSGAGYHHHGSSNAAQNFGAKTTFTYTGGGGGGAAAQQVFAVQDGEIVDTVFVGPRPNGCWMEPFTFQIRNTGAATAITNIDWTPQTYFSLVAPELPAPIGHNEDIDVQLATGTSSNTDWQMVALYGNTRTAAIWNINAEPYDPAIPDVVEMPYVLDGNTNTTGIQPLLPGFNYEGAPAQITPTILHDNYTLPFPEIPEGPDAVYKFTVEQDVIISAYVGDADGEALEEAGKVALYKQEGEELPHPMADNNYIGLPGVAGGGGGAASTPFEAQIGEGTSTTGYLPMYYLYNYSLSTQLYLGTELTEAGATTAPMTSISWFSNSTYGYDIQNVSIWMANVTDTQAPTTSPLGSGMSLVYQGNFQEVVGWNEFVFNAGSFAWDGSSNVLVMVQMNNGDWGSSIQWQCGNVGFNAGSYVYQDNTPYNAGTTNYSLSTTTTRANIIMKGGSRDIVEFEDDDEISAGPQIANLPITAGTYYLVASAAEMERAFDDPDFHVYINVDEMPCPQTEAEGFAFNPTPADDQDEVEPASVTLRWNIPEYATGWRLVFGSTYYPDPNHPQTIMYPEDGSFSRDMANSYTVRNLWNNTNYFWRVEFNNEGCPDGVSSPVWGFTTHLNIPQNLTVEDETVFNDEEIVLNWDAVVDRTYRYYNVYRDEELIGHTDVNDISNTTFTDGPLAYNMEGYTYYVTAVYDEGESAPCDPVTVKVSGYGDVNGHVYEQDGTTGIAGATVTMVGQDEFGVSHTYNFTTNGQGYYTGHIYAGVYNGSAACAGYQSVNAPVQGNPINVDYNQTASPYDYIMDENFDPVCGVIAEYYPDSLDPNSPYVKVYWGCGLPGSDIVEDFETGDFSLFDWQLGGN
ncbi:MAG: fibronectin type III domain-containing protein, partial [Bacteroidaceae bacterium]|nr:fibronectin type III domain-containing protein [Bacteroidaceae bacterium]